MKLFFSRSYCLHIISPGLLTFLVACSVEDAASDERTDMREGPSAQTLAPTLDASLATDAGSARDAATSLADAGTAAGDAGGDPCGAGKVTCGATCIEVIAPTAAAVQERVFGRSCGLSRSCHGGLAPQASLNLDSLDALFGSVVGKPAVEVPALALIAPGRPEDSYLVRKLRNTHGSVGTVMPPGSPLCEPKIQAVEAWIRAGATE